MGTVGMPLQALSINCPALLSSPGLIIGFVLTMIEPGTLVVLRFRRGRVYVRDWNPFGHIYGVCCAGVNVDLWRLGVAARVRSEISNPYCFP